MVLTRMLICVTDRPIKAGAISQPIRRTPSWAKSNRQPKRSPAWRRAGIWLRNWASPPMTTPTATARIGSANSGASRKAAAMIAMLNSTGENAGAAKLRTEFSTPIASAASPMNNRYGNMIRVSRMVRACCSASPLKPGAISLTIQGDAKIPRTQTPVRMVRSVVKAALASSQASRLVRWARYSLKTGMKAADIEPSAKSSLKRLGMR